MARRQPRAQAAEQRLDRLLQPGEQRGVDFFAYKPVHLESGPPKGALARIVNRVGAILNSGDYDGAIWTQGSPRIEETLYWLNLLLDTTLPLCGNAAQRVHGVVHLGVELDAVAAQAVRADRREAVGRRAR